MGGLQRFEQKLEQVISGAFAKAFRSAVQPVEIAAALQRECDNNAQILSRERRLVPNEFHVELAQTDLDRLGPYDGAMARDFTEQLTEHARQQGYQFPGAVRIDFEAAEDLSTGRFRVRSSAQASIRSQPNNQYDDQYGAQGPAGRTTSRAFVVAGGQQHPLSRLTVVGRGTEADIRVNDPGVSRRHIEFEVGDGGHGLQVRVRDLGSTNGMLVDGHRISSTSVRDGTEVKIGSTTLTVRVVEDSREGSHV